MAMVQMPSSTGMGISIEEDIHGSVSFYNHEGKFLDLHVIQYDVVFSVDALTRVRFTVPRSDLEYIGSNRVTDKHGVEITGITDIMVSSRDQHLMQIYSHDSPHATYHPTAVLTNDDTTVELEIYCSNRGPAYPVVPVTPSPEVNPWQDMNFVDLDDGFI